MKTIQSEDHNDSAAANATVAVAAGKETSTASSFAARSGREIVLLPPQVVDQIAAGEVVERPAHLVKELVENSIDAGATIVEVEFSEGGRQVRVTDNGSGISRDSLGLALARHATSKISKADDLWNLASFGFRGEALASIAAVSRLTLFSKTRDADQAYRIQCEFGALGPVEPAAGNNGTTVVVEDLFQNVPARLKFLKSEGAETAQIRSALKNLALVHADVEMRVRVGGKLENVWPATGSELERAKVILAEPELFEAFAADGSVDQPGYQARVIFASPHKVNKTSKQILIFSQNRSVVDRSLQAAVIDAFRGLLMHGEFPTAVVMLRVPPDEVDVNIHPTKSQVKFRDPQTAFRAVHRTLRHALESAPWAKRSAPSGLASVASRDEAAETRRTLTVAELTRPYSSSREVERQPSLINAGTSLTDNLSLAGFAVAARSRIDALAARSRADFNEEPSRTEHSVASECDHAAQAFGLGGVWSQHQVIGQVALTYIVLQSSDRMILVDQHAAHERVAYERLMRAFSKNAPAVQPLLVPAIVELESEPLENLLRSSHELEKLGVSVDAIGPHAVQIRAIPAGVSIKAVSQAVLKFAEEITERGGSFAVEKAISDVCASMACHSVVRAGQSLTMEQMRELLVQMDEFPLSGFCPHGRTVSVEIPFAKLERDFGRIV